MPEHPIIPPDENDPPQDKIEEILDHLMMMTWEKKVGSSNVDLSSIPPEQLNKMLDIVSKADDQAFESSKVWTEKTTEIELARIQAGTVNQRTIRYGLLTLLLGVSILTVLILFFKDEYFLNWLSFLAGLIGGYGLKSAGKDLFHKPQEPNPLLQEADDPQ